MGAVYVRSVWVCKTFVDGNDDFFLKIMIEIYFVLLFILFRLSLSVVVVIILLLLDCCRF